VITFFNNLFQSVQGKLVRHYNEAGSTRNLIFHSSLTLTLTSAISYALGLVRDKTFAYQFGAGSALDIYNAAFVVPDFIFAVFVSGALSAAFVPIFTSLDEKSRPKAFVYINQVLSWLMIILSLFSLVFALLLPSLVQYLVPGFSSDQHEQYIITTRVLLLAPFFFTLSNTFGNALLSTRDFLWYGLAPVMYNIGIVTGALVLVPLFGWSGLVIGTVIGAFLHMLMRAQAIWRYGFRFKLDLEFSKELKETLWLMVPKMAQIGMWQIMLWWFILLASKAEAGSVTIYNFAYNFQSVPVSLIGIAIALASYARLSHLSAHGNYRDFILIVKSESVKILGLTGLAGIALAIVAHPLVNFFLGGGKFGDSAVTTTALMLSVYAISVPLESWMHLLSRAHYSLKNTLRPSLIHIVAILFAMFLSYILMPRIGLFALPAAFSAGFALQCVLLCLSLWNLLKGRDKAGISR
jgi:putative peptidoglycan lipid II flippase